MAGAPSDFPFVRAPLYAERDGRFDSAFEKARECFARDSEPDSSSRAVKECWLSTYAFRQVLYKAGRNLGEKAVDSLDPQSSGTRREYYVHAVSSATTVEPELGEVVKDTGSGGPRIRCPKCNWSPRPDDLWSCKCGHQWNTFDTGGVCPNCLYQWTVTQCLACREISPHSDWYTTG